MDLSYILNHLGEDREKYFNAVSPPIIQSSNFCFESIADIRNKIGEEYDYYVYTRGINPTVDILRKKIAALEHAEDCLIVGSGATAIGISVMNAVKSGDHIICVNKPYSWTTKLLSSLLSKFDVSTTFVDATDIGQIKAARRDNTKVLVLESPNSLTFEIQDLSACAAFCSTYGITSIIDNSHCSPYFQNPIDFGIDIVIHSATKYICGHSDVVMGVICSTQERIRSIFNNEYMTLGTIVSPNDAAMAIRGLRTLPLRLDRVEQSGKRMFEYFSQHPKVSKVYYPLDPNSTQYELAKRQIRGCGGLISIVLKVESKKEVEVFSDALKTFIYAVSWGGHESLKMPTLAFHDMPGKPDPIVSWKTIRFYIGLEETSELIADFENAFALID